MSGSIKNIKSIHNIQRTVDKTNKVGSFEFNINELQDDLMNFDTLSKIMQIVISDDYNRFLPKDFWKNNFANCNFEYSCNPNLSTDEILKKQNDYSKDVESLRIRLGEIIKPYTFFTNHDQSLQKQETIKVNNYLVSKSDGIGSDSDTDRHFPISVDLTYTDFLSVRKHIQKLDLISLAEEDIKLILKLLSNISAESAYLTSATNSFKSFLTDLIFKIYGNVSKVYPKSIINYAVFQFCLDKYPYETPSGRLYSISNINPNLKNKFEIIDIYYKNIDAILSFINDISFIQETDTNKKQFETNVLKNAYGLIMALSAFIAEENTYQVITSSSLDGAIINKVSSLRSVFNKLYEVHE